MRIWVARPKGYDAAAYGRDIAVFRPFMKQSVPEMILLGPGGVGEGVELAAIGLAGNQLKSEDLLKATGPAFAAFSYRSLRRNLETLRKNIGTASQTTSEAALSEDFLSRAGRIEEFYGALRDKFEPGKPISSTETADAHAGVHVGIDVFGQLSLSRPTGTSRNGACRWCATRWHRAIMACWMKIPSPRGPTTGRLFSRGNLMGTASLDPGASSSRP